MTLIRPEGEPRLRAVLFWGALLWLVFTVGVAAL